MPPGITRAQVLTDPKLLDEALGNEYMRLVLFDENGAPFNLVGGEMGPQGPMGPAGPRGDTGPKGDKGDKGDTGSPGPTGNPGPQGATGTQGFVGPQGSAGPPGPTGEPGPKGDKGDKGDTGNTGGQGLPGAQGPQGPQGPQGLAGVAVPTLISHTWAIGGVTLTAGMAVPVIFIPVAAGTVVKVTGVRAMIAGGTSVGVQLQRNGSNVGSVVTVTPTPALTSYTPVTLADGDRLGLVLSAPVGSPNTLSFSVIVEHSPA